MQEETWEKREIERKEEEEERLAEARPPTLEEDTATTITQEVRNLKPYWKGIMKMAGKFLSFRKKSRKQVGSWILGRGELPGIK